MGVYGIGTNTNEIFSEELRGKMYKIAGKIWFTSNGKPLPLFFKYEDDKGILQPVEEITLKYVEDKNYAGIPTKVCNCEAIIDGIMKNFKLIFFTDTCKWVMVI